jgi:hypothetical protein
MSHGVFEITPFGTGNPDIVSVPDILFPPGYPMLIAISSFLLQLPVEVIAPFLSLVALIALPVVIVFSFHRVIGLLPALSLGILVVLTPAAVRHGYIAFGDTLSIILVIYAIHRLLIADDKPANWFYLGLLTGFSYLLRNANLGLLITIALYLFWQLIVTQNRKQIITNGLICLGANILIIVPWLMRNFLVFGKFQPYWMEPSTVSLGENIQDFVKAQLDTLLALDALDELLASSLWGIGLLLILVAVLIYQLITTWQRWEKTEQQAFFVTALYALIGAAMVIAARTKYQWGIHIYSRYALPYSCFIFVALILIVKNTYCKINLRYLGSGLAIILVMRVYELPKLYEQQRYVYDQNVMSTAKQITANQDVMCTDLNGRLALSNYAFVYRILCATPARHVFPGFRHNEFIDKSLTEWATLGAKRGVVVSLFPDKGAGDLPLKQEELNRLNSLGWQVERNTQGNLILSHKASEF